MTRPDGVKFTIDAPENAPDSFYVRKLTLNGKNWPHNYVEFGDLAKGAKLRFSMGTEPALDRGTKAEDKPYSFSRE